MNKKLVDYLTALSLGVILGIEIRKTFTERLPFIAAAQNGIKELATRGIPVVWMTTVDEDEVEDAEGEDDE